MANFFKTVAQALERIDRLSYSRSFAMFKHFLSVLLIGLASLRCFAADPEAPTHSTLPGRAYVTVQASVVIQRPTDEVFAFVSNAENDIQWRSEVLSMKNVTPPPFGVGTRTVEVAKVLGKQLETTTEITEFVPGVRMGRRTVSGPTPVDTERWVAPVNEGARFTYKLQADVTDVFLFKAFRPLLEWWTQRKIEGYLVKLKAHMEAPQASSRP